MSKLIRKLVVSLVLTLLLPTANASAPTLPTATVEVSKPAAPSKDYELQLKIEKLIQCESGGRNITIMDTNGRESAGVLQFQLQTFVTYAKRYSIVPNAPENELVNYWKDSDIQRELAYRMVKENPNNFRHWFNCSRKLGFL